MVGRTIVRCELNFPTIVRHPEPEEFVDAVVGMRIDSMGRRGKYILISLTPPHLWGGGGEAAGGATNNLLLVVHLGMTGQLRLVDPVAPLENHTHAVFFLEDGHQLRYRDPRRFGRLLLGTEQALLSSKKMPRLGPEPIDPGFAADELYRRLRKRRAAIKAVLLDQGAIAGVGNIYADESLHKARLRPDRIAGALSVVVVGLTIAITAGAFTDLDLQVALATHDAWQPSLHPLFQLIAELGSIELTTILMLALTVYLWRAGFGSDALVFVVFIA